MISCLVKGSKGHRVGPFFDSSVVCFGARASRIELYWPLWFNIYFLSRTGALSRIV